MFDETGLAAPDMRHGVWALSATGLSQIEAATEGLAIVFVPSEQVTILAVDLPLASLAQRRAALPFAVEDLIAESLDGVHIALGAEISPRRHLAGVVGRAVMQDWIAQLASAGFERYALVPDALALPPPVLGGWSVSLDHGRMLVRTEEEAFAIDPALLHDLWSAQGEPPLTAYGDMPLPLDLASQSPFPAAATRRGPPALDLRQGAFALARARAPLALRRLAAVLAVGVVAHTLIAGLDTLALQKIADERRAETATLLQASAPGSPVDGDLVDRLSRLSVGTEPGRFLPLLTRTSQAIAPLTSEVALQSLTYAEADGALALKVEAADLSGLQRTQTALADAGLRPSSGPASSDSGRAEGEITLHEISAVSAP